MVSRFTGITCITALLTLAACTGSKSYYKKGLRLDEAGMVDEAAKFYLISLEKNAGNVDAKIALKKAGQRVLDDMWADFYTAYTAGEYKKTVYNFHKAKSYFDKITKYLKMEMPDNYQEYYEESKGIYVEDQYNTALAHFDDEQFSKANELFNEIDRLEPGFANVEVLKAHSKAEPLYRKAMDQMNAGSYRKAYFGFSKVDNVVKGYKDALDLKKEALDKASFTIAIFPPTGGASEKMSMTDQLYSRVVEELDGKNNPFIRVIDRSMTDKLLEEQKLALAGVVDEEGAAEAGKMLGAKYVLNINVNNFSKEVKPPSATRRKGYEQYKVKKVDPKTGAISYPTKYRKTYYREMYGRHFVSASMKYTLVSSETGEILSSDVFQKQDEDVVNYTIYDGNWKMLYPGTFRSLKGKHSSDQVFTDPRRKNQLNAKFRTKKRSLNSIESMKASLIQQSGKAIANQINAYEKRRP